MIWPKILISCQDSWFLLTMLKKNRRIWCRVAPLTFDTFKIEIKFEFEFKSTVDDEFKDVFRILVSWDLFDLEFSDNCNADYLEVLHQIDTIDPNDDNDDNDDNGDNDDNADYLKVLHQIDTILCFTFCIKYTNCIT